jgi:hypothetical protein
VNSLTPHGQRPRRQRPSLTQTPRVPLAGRSRPV